MKEKVEFGNIKIGECFRLTKNGPIYQKDEYQGGQKLIGKEAGKATDWINDNDKVYPVKVKISEVK